MAKLLGCYVFMLLGVIKNAANVKKLIEGFKLMVLRCVFCSEVECLSLASET